MNEDERISLMRTRVLLDRLHGEQERLGADLERSGITDFADRADWLMLRRTPDEQLAWRRRWQALGIRCPAGPSQPAYERPASLADRRPPRRDPELEVALRVYDSLPPDRQRQWATARAQRTA